MQNFVITLLICSVTMSVIALFYMAVTPSLVKRYSVTGCYYAWLILVVGLIIPFRPQFGSSIVKVTVLGNTAAPLLQIGNGAPVAVSTFAKGVVPASVPVLSWWESAAAIWLAGMMVFLIFHGVRHYRFVKMTSRWSENVTDEPTLALFHNLKIQMGISQSISLKICDIIGSPMLLGFVRPCILLPGAEFADDELLLILKHELVHYKRKDLWYKCLVLTAAAIHWFNPIVHLMAKEINLQCELSCDAEVVNSTGIETRWYYSETIISVIRRQSKLKTALSTNFYGGKKGMKKRIFSIMDMNKKKTGTAVLFCALILTLGTGAAFAANITGTQPQASQETAPFGYSFKPDPDIYSKYSSYGITISDDGSRLLYDGQVVRLFIDERSNTEAFFLNEAGVADLQVVRNEAGSITAIEPLSEEKAQEYRSAFFAGDTGSNVEVKENVQETVEDRVQEADGENKLKQYSAYGITLSEDGNVMYHSGQRVKLFVDQLSDGSFQTFWTDEAGTVNLSVERNHAGEITDIKRISEKDAQKYQLLSEGYEAISLIPPHSKRRETGKLREAYSSVAGLRV